MGMITTAVIAAAGNAITYSELHRKANRSTSRLRNEVSSLEQEYREHKRKIELMEAETLRYNKIGLYLLAALLITGVAFIVSLFL